MGLFVLKENRTKPINIIFFLLCLTTFIWQFTFAILFQLNNPEIALFLVKFVYLFIIFLPTTLYHFLTNLAENKKEEKWVYSSYAVSTLFAITLLSDNLFVDGYYEYFWGYYPKAGAIHPLHVLQTAIVVSRGLYIAYKAMLKAESLHKKQLQYCIVALFIYFLAAVDYLCNYGFEFYPPGIIFITISLGIIAYSITQFQLMNVSVILTEQLANLCTLIVICTVYVCGYFIYERLLEPRSDLITLLLNLIFFTVAIPSFYGMRKEIQTNPG